MKDYSSNEERRGERREGWGGRRERRKENNRKVGNSPEKNLRVFCFGECNDWPWNLLLLLIVVVVVKGGRGRRAANENGYTKGGILGRSRKFRTINCQERRKEARKIKGRGREVKRKEKEPRLEVI